MTHTDANPTRALATIGWGLYCASSWTWCIGMFLPIILLDRYGWPGFIAFAVPNVIGCAAFGYVVRTRARSETIVGRHGAAMRWFSLVTIAYQLHFVGFVAVTYIPAIGDRHLLVMAPALVVFVVALVLAALPDRAWPWLATLVYLGSLGAFGVCDLGSLGDVGWLGSRPSAEIAWLAPTIALGFALCPYLDPTFHRALQRSPSRHAFGVFGITFAVMLLLTAAYAGFASSRFHGVILGHMFGQAIFTAGVHLRELGPAGAGRPGPGRRWIVLLPLLAAPIVLLTRRVIPVESVEDPTYLRFLVFYALFFPAYVLVFMSRRGGGVATRRGVIVFVLAMLALAPLDEAAFLHGAAWLAAIPPAALLAWLLLRRAGVIRSVARSSA